MISLFYHILPNRPKMIQLLRFHPKKLLYKFEGFEYRNMDLVCIQHCPNHHSVQLELRLLCISKTFYHLFRSNQYSTTKHLHRFQLLSRSTENSNALEVMASIVNQQARRST